MKHALARLWQHHRAALIGFLLAGMITLFFAVRFLFYSVYWSNPQHRNEPPRPWMTVNYVAHSWKVPAEAVLAAMGMSQAPGHRTTLAQIATSMGITEAVLISRLQVALAKMPVVPGQ